MDATSFDLAISFPRDTRYLSAVRLLAVHAAEYAGSAAADASSFGQAVEDAFQGCLTDASAADVAIMFRRASGPLEVTVDGRLLTLTV
jgi:hypothetical protein